MRGKSSWCPFTRSMPAVVLLEERERESGHGVRQLVQEVEAQAAAQQRVDDLGEAVQPLERHRVLGRRVRDGVVAVLVEALRHAVLEVRVADAQRVRRGVVGEQEGVGVELGDVEGRRRA